MPSNRVLLTVSGVIPVGLDDAVRSGERPRVDYLELAKAFDADLVDYGAVETSQGRLAKLVRRVVGRNVALAMRCFSLRKSYDVIVTDGEQVGLPFAAMTQLLSRRRRPQHLMIVHILSVPKKSWLFRVLHLGRRIDEMVVYASAQKTFITERLGFPCDRVTLSPFMVDSQFFDPARSTTLAGPRATISAAGLERRDYPTLLAAIDGLPADVVLAATSPWSKRSSALDGVALPENVEVVRMTLHELRSLYQRSDVVVMPLHDVDFQAGVTTILEAMSMGRAVVCSRTAGQTDIISDGVTGIYVPVGDVRSMRAAIEDLLEHPDRSRILGDNARQWVVQTADIEVYVRHLAGRVDHLRQRKGL